MSKFFSLFNVYYLHISIFFSLISSRKQMAYDAKFMRNPKMSWLGAFPSDFEKYGLPTECLLPLTAEGEAFPFEATVSVQDAF